MSIRTDADKIVRSHVLWAMGGGLIPIPVLDFATVTVVQLEMLQQLAQIYEVNYSQNTAKAFVSALTGTAFARMGASIVKSIPGIGTVVGGASMSLMSGASTYAIGKVAISLFSTSRNLDNFNEEQIKNDYKDAYEKGKNYVSDLQKNKDDASTSAQAFLLDLQKQNKQNETSKIFQSLENLGKLKEKGILSELEFKIKKQQLLDRL